MKSHKTQNRILSFILTLVLLLTLIPGTAAFAATGSKSTDKLDPLTVTFLDVGQGDSAVLECGGKVMMIDGGKPKESSKIYSWLKKNDIDYIDYMVASHPDADHIGGLSGALNYAKVGKAYCSVTEGDTETFKDLVKYLGKQNKKLEVPEAGDTFSLGDADVEVLGPTTTERDSDDTNNSSLVLKVTLGETSFLFTGDAEREEEQDLLDANADLKSTVLKVSHHGSAGATSVLNTNTHKFHYPDCSSVKQMKDKNKEVVTESRDQIISEGYEPCKRCNP